MFIVAKDEVVLKRMLNIMFAFIPQSYSTTILEQISNAVIKKDETEQHVFYEIYANTSSTPLPREIRGLPFCVNINYNDIFYTIEILVHNSFVTDLKLYNFDCAELDTTCLYQGHAEYVPNYDQHDGNTVLAQQSCNKINTTELFN